MSYIVNTFDGVEAYLRDLPGISESARQRVTEAFLEILAEHADYFLKECPLAHESYFFQFDYLIIDGGSFYTFRFIGDGSSMPFGVVQVIYVDCATGPLVNWPPPTP